MTTWIPLNRIKGLSEKRRVPVLGKIRLGVKVLSQKGETPTETPYFVVPPEVEKVYGKQPTELDVMFPSNNPRVIFPQAYKWYGSSNRLKCIGNGEKALRVNPATFTKDERPCPCEYLETGQCSERASLLIMLPTVNPLVTYQIDIGSYHSIIDLNSYLDFLLDPIAGIGRIAMVSLKLRRIPKITHQGGTRTHWPLQLRFEGSEEDVAKLRQESPEFNSRIRTFDVQPPDDINPAQDPGAMVVLTNDLQQKLEESLTPNKPTTAFPMPSDRPSTLPVPTTNQASTTLNRQDTTSAMPGATTASNDGNEGHHLEGHPNSGRSQHPLPTDSPTTDRQRTAILKRAASHQISRDQALQIIHSYTKGQASERITPLDHNDASVLRPISSATP